MYEWSVQFVNKILLLRKIDQIVRINCLLSDHNLGALLSGRTILALAKTFRFNLG